jgi:hypothetical protein
MRRFDRDNWKERMIMLVTVHLLLRTLYLWIANPV